MRSRLAERLTASEIRGGRKSAVHIEATSARRWAKAKDTLTTAPAQRRFTDFSPRTIWPTRFQNSVNL